MKIKLHAALPGATDPILPLPDDGTSGGTNGGGAPVVPQQGGPPAPQVPATPTAHPGQAPAAGASQVGPNGFPEGTPLAEMSVQEQLSYLRYWNRQNRNALEQRDGTLAQREAEIAALRPKAEQFDSLQAASQTDAERAAADAEKRGREAADADARTRYGRPLLQARLESLLAGRMAAEQVEVLAGGLDVGAFLGADGLPDAAKVKAFADTIPAAAPAQQQAAGPVQLGAGRTGPVQTQGVEAGADLYRSLRKRSG